MVRKMIGPGGAGGCSVFACTKRAVETILYDVKWYDKDPYQIEYYFCKKHEGRRFDPWQYPQFTIVKETKHE